MRIGTAGLRGLFGVGFVLLAHFVPPLSPTHSVEQTLQIYRDHTNSSRTGLLLCYVGTMGYLMFGSGIVGQTRRIKHIPPTITYLRVSSCAAASLLIIRPLTTWLTVAFRPVTGRRNPSSRSTTLAGSLSSSASPRS